MIRLIQLLLLLLISQTAFAGNAKHPQDPHYTESGFFDVHVCNWPDRPPFYLVVYSTEYFSKIESVNIINANGDLLGALDLSKYKAIKRKNKPPKRAYLTHIPVPKDRLDGWFEAEIRLKGGVQDRARDFVIHQMLMQASGQQPEPGAEDVSMPGSLRWDKIDGAAWYQVFIRDMWNEDKLIFSSKLISKPEIKLPSDLLKPGGYYAWKVHARDLNGHIQLGDFNLGSQSEWVEFSVTED